MNDTATTATIDLSDLTDNGDTIDLPDGIHSLRLVIEADQYTHINDFDCYGRIEWSHRRNDFGYSIRPDGMDGNARKVRHDHGIDLWWQPWEGATPDEADKFYREHLNELIEYGFSDVGLELRETLTDSLGNSHVVVLDTEYLGGVDDAFDRDCMAELLGELLSMLTHNHPAILG